ncbi:hypothetical protein EVAR_86385_1 [Eumeta japonica]|uniref:Uncharacterized protein n=1 Tax=Eumeta variegata TaxID=151549 RepID=A0A4C1W7X5_EUMVA|nr:hypothetical protein EVAR_86385_1 [Eumeta japonica]
MNREGGIDRKTDTAYDPYKNYKVKLDVLRFGVLTAVRVRADGPTNMSTNDSNVAMSERSEKNAESLRYTAGHTRSAIKLGIELGCTAVLLELCGRRVGELVNIYNRRYL